MGICIGVRPPKPCKGYALHYRATGGPCWNCGEKWTASCSLASLQGPICVGSEAAERLCSTAMVVGLLNAGRLNGIKIGHRWRVPVSAVIEYLKTTPVRHRVRPSRDVEPRRIGWRTARPGATER